MCGMKSRWGWVNPECRRFDCINHGTDVCKECVPMFDYKKKSDKIDGIEEYIKKREKINSYNKEWTKKWKEKIGNDKFKEAQKIVNKRRRNKVKNLVFNHYGNKCTCCGENIREFLSIDHINGNGNKHRKEIGCKSGSAGIYQWIVKNNFPKTFQVLCHNCNQGKYINGGICPHKVIGEMESKNDDLREMQK